MRLEVNMVVKSAVQASDYYKHLLGAEILSKTNLEQGMNETMMHIGETDIRILDENESLGMIAPKVVGGSAMWLNIWVEDIDSYIENVTVNGGTIISPIQKFPGPAKNAVFSDQFNHVWVVNQQY